MNRFIKKLLFNLSVLLVCGLILILAIPDFFKHFHEMYEIIRIFVPPWLIIVALITIIIPWDVVRPK